MAVNPRTKRLLTIIVCLSLLSACSSLFTVQVDLAEVSEGSGRSPLGTLKPMAFVIHVDDQRLIEDGLVGVQSEVRLISEKEVPLILYNAVKTELEKNGHTVVDTEDGSLDLEVCIVLHRFLSSRPHLFTTEIVAEILADITIRDARKDAIVFSQPIEVVSVLNEGLLESGAEQLAAMVFLTPLSILFYYPQVQLKRYHETALNGALTEFVTRFARDPSILKSLELFQQEKSQGGLSQSTGNAEAACDG